MFGRTIGDKDIKAELLSALKKQLQLRGLSETGCAIDVSDETVKLYMEEAKLYGRSTTQAIDKTSARYTAERSLRSMMAFLTTVATASFVPEDSGELSTRLIQNNKLAALVSEAMGDVPLTSVHDDLILSTDDTTLFVFAGEADKQLVPYRIANANGRTGTYGAYKLDDLKHIEGTRVRLTVTMSGGGMIAPLYLTFTGLNARELLESTCPSGVLVIKIPGLCVGGAVDPCATFGEGFGYVVFMRGKDEGANEDSPQLINFTHYRRNVLHPFVECIRENLHEFVKGTEIPPRLMCVSWTDGDINQVAAIKKTEMVLLDRLKKITSAKHSPQTSGTEQPCDNAPTFRTLRQLTPYTSASGSIQLALKAAIEKAFRSHKEKLVLKTGKMNALSDFVATAPFLFSKAATPNAIRHGFFETGLVTKPNGSDRNGSDRGRQGPSMSMIEKTLKRSMTEEERGVYNSALPSFISVSINKGHIPEEEYDKAGIPADMNAQGEVVLRDAGITQEYCQRSKVISHEEQERQRMVFHEEMLQAAQQKKEHANAKVMSILDDNTNAEKKLWELMGKEDPPPGQNIRPELRHATLEHFEKMPVAFLKAFVHVRLCDSHKPPTGLIPKTKLNRLAAESGTPCLIKSAFDCRDCRYLKLKSVRNEGPAAATSTTVASPLVLTACSLGMESEYFRKI